MSALAIGPWFQVADLNIGLLFVVGIGALGIFGIVLGGWSSNSHYSLLGALRSAAQLVSYETAAGMAIVGALLLAGTLSIREIIEAQEDYRVWFVFASPVGFLHLCRGVNCRNQSRALRSTGSGIGIGGGLHDGVQWIPLGALFPGRVHEHGCCGVDCYDAISGRVAAAVRRIARV